MKFTYRRKPFKRPLIDVIEEYIDARGFKIYPEYVYRYFTHRNFKMPNGKKAKSVEQMVNYLNGLFLSNNPLPPVKPPTKLKKKPKPKPKWIPYDEQLQDPRWLEFREKVFKARGRVCEHCGSIEVLQVHHPKYIHGRKAWEYSTDEVIVLCKKCHEKEHHIDDDKV